MSTDQDQSQDRSADLDGPGVCGTCGYMPQVLVCPECMDGRWVVETASGSFYLIDLDAMTHARTPDPDAVEGVPERAVEAQPFGVSIATGRLRRDAETIPLLHLSPVLLGSSMRMLLDVVGDGVTQTLRSTNTVVSVRRAA